jgi:hypothetical protein
MEKRKSVRLAQSSLMLERDARLIKSLIKSLDALQVAIYKYIEATHVQQEAAKNQHQQHSPIPVDIRSELTLPVAVREYYEAEQRERPTNWWRRLKVVLEIAGIVAAIGLATFTGLTLKQIVKQTEELEVDSRPWLRMVDVTLDNSIPDAPILSFSPAPTVKPATSANLRAEFRIKNIGKGVAQNISIEPSIFFEPYRERSSTDLTADAETSSCEYSLQHTPLPTEFTWSAIFPGDEVKHGIVIAEPFRDDAISHIPNRAGNWLAGALIACVTYQYPKQYQTRAVFYIMGPRDRFVEVGKNLDISSLHLLRDEHYEHAQ